ncbi:hypothetical protein [Paenibacillus donghaensis]|uniref:Uncharacterized protein n=1 Tax=Paenibacillus donghaensis TaxID=414771 RepID=A0A2Z2KAR6_9BACL|nr:hypothetical protein [Paenibacillus donghaensis]ASA22587.1 hypothetical protein B9T62_18445 [Paenibacillus donghaensis]
MKTNIFIPTKIKVGFQNRDNTYTKKLAYVIYEDHKGVLRKKASWESWRDNNIDPVDYENEPTSGFVLNKKVGDYVSDWNHRQAYVRVYDPRGFEFEITIENLLYILENANSIKGKGLEGEFVYAWEGKELVLIPVESPDYQEISSFNKILHNKEYIKSKELIIGATYKTKDNQELVYMGRFDYWDRKWIRGEQGEESRYKVVNKGKHYIFASETTNYRKKPDLYAIQLKSLGDRVIGCLSEECTERYAYMFDLLEHKSYYSPQDESKDEFVYYTKDRFCEKIRTKIGNYAWHYSTSIYIGNDIDSAAEVIGDAKDNNSFNLRIRKKVTSKWNYGGYSMENVTIFSGSLEDLWEQYKPRYRDQYLVNGKLFQSGDEE